MTFLLVFSAAKLRNYSDKIVVTKYCYIKFMNLVQLSYFLIREEERAPLSKRPFRPINY